MKPGVGLEPALVARVEGLLRDRLVAAKPAGGGYSSAQRWIVEGRGGRTAFAKIGATPVSEMNLRREAAVYGRLSLACMPEVQGWDADSPSILLLSDLSKSVWPPPGTVERVDRALRAIDSVHSAQAFLPPYAEVQDPDEDWWGRVAAQPEPFLRLGIVRSDWFQRNVDLLIASGRTVSCAGSSVTHYDLRSDNLCFAPTETYLVDWSHACLGNARLDLALFLPSLAADGGPDPESILPADPAAASWVAGFFAWHAAKPEIPTAPTVRAMQRRLLVSALPWVVRALDLEPLRD